MRKRLFMNLKTTVSWLLNHSNVNWLLCVFLLCELKCSIFAVSGLQILRFFQVSIKTEWSAYFCVNGSSLNFPIRCFQLHWLQLLVSAPHSLCFCVSPWQCADSGLPQKFQLQRRTMPAVIFSMNVLFKIWSAIFADSMRHLVRFFCSKCELHVLKTLLFANLIERKPDLSISIKSHVRFLWFLLVMIPWTNICHPLSICHSETVEYWIRSV